MEAFEQVVKIYLEAHRYVVSSGVKFPIKRRIAKKNGRIEFQTHGYEADLVGARNGSLVLASAKSLFGSRGVSKQGFRGIADIARRTHFTRYTMFNEADVADGMLREASERYGYPPEQIRFMLFVGKFHTPDEGVVRDHLAAQMIGAGAVQVVGLPELIATLQEVAVRKTYINDPVVMTLRVLHAAGVVNSAPIHVKADAVGLAEFEDQSEDEDEESEDE